MKTRTLAFAIAAAALGFSSVSQAQDYRHHQRASVQHDRGDARQAPAQRDWQRDGRDGRDYNRDRSGARDHRQYGDNRNHHQYGDNRGHRQFNDSHGYRHSARGAQFYRGGYMPYEYRQPQYVVRDWGHHRLSAPPYGHQWTQVGSDYVLVAIATGLIANLILSQ